MGRKKVGDPNESGQDKFRRLVNQRLKPLLARYDQITNMMGQPSYDPSDNDIKHLVKTVTIAHDKLVYRCEKALEGTLKAREIKEFSGIDWDEELTDDETNESDTTGD